MVEHLKKVQGLLTSIVIIHSCGFCAQLTSWWVLSTLYRSISLCVVRLVTFLLYRCDDQLFMSAAAEAGVAFVSCVVLPMDAGDNELNGY